MPDITRRSFINSSALTAAGASLTFNNIFGASDIVRIAIVGLKSKGQGLIKNFARESKAKIVALCDVDSDIINQASQNNKELIGKVDLVEDYRKLLERKDIDAVVLATPNHWHALQTIWACQAGKDVYVEKPCSHTIWEGRKMIEAARKYDRIVQVGLQASSNNVLPEVVEWIRAGHIGKIKAIHALWYRPRKSIGKKAQPIQIPDSVNYDLWLGPAEDQPIYRDNLHYDWHWDWNTGNGEMGNIGTHVVDIARAFLGDPAPPRSVATFGNRFHWNDAGNTPNMHVAAFDFEEVPILLELNNFKLSPDNPKTPGFHKINRGEVVICEGGEFRGHASGKIYDTSRKVIKQFKGGGQHHANFLNAVISRRKDDLNCEIERGHASCSLALLGGVAWRAGKQTSADDLKKQISHCEWLTDAFDRYHKQAKDWGFNFAKEPWISNINLTYDGKSETFVGKSAEEANQFLKRKVYRSPFIVPETV